jgi:hypothetical protein
MQRLFGTDGVRGVANTELSANLALRLGAVLGWSYHDLIDRVRILGPDNAWTRLQKIIRWFDEVQASGGYRKYYAGSREGTLQGGGTASTGTISFCA